jgi:hypothetical protein
MSAFLNTVHVFERGCFRVSDQGSMAIIIASKGRPVELGRWADHVARQNQLPSLMIWAVTAEEDLPAGWHSLQSETLKIVFAPPGACSQRNAGLSALPKTIDIVAFFDDDYIPAATCMAGIAAFFAAHPQAAGATGHLLADGIKSPGIPYEEALAMLQAYEAAPAATALNLEHTEGLYGCNMAFRHAAIAGERFDEKLPFYSWQEDVDFAQRVRRNGAIGRTNAFSGVHQGVKTGRTSGRRLGYSQVANPIYLYAKGTMSARKMLSLITRNLASNHLKTPFPEPYVDRWGRVQGNWLALGDLLTGGLHPERIIQL